MKQYKCGLIYASIVLAFVISGFANADETVNSSEGHMVEVKQNSDEKQKCNQYCPYSTSNPYNV